MVSRLHRKVWTRPASRRMPSYEADPIDGTQHEALIHFDLAACIDGVEMPESLSDIRLPKIPTNDYGKSWLPDEKYVVFCNNAAPGWDRKRWQGYVGLAHLLKDEYKIVIVGSDNDKRVVNYDEYPEGVQYHWTFHLRQVAAML